MNSILKTLTLFTITVCICGTQAAHATGETIKFSCDTTVLKNGSMVPGGLQPETKDENARFKSLLMGDPLAQYVTKAPLITFEIPAYFKTESHKLWPSVKVHPLDRTNFDHIIFPTEDIGQMTIGAPGEGQPNTATIAVHASIVSSDSEMIRATSNITWNRLTFMLFPTYGIVEVFTASERHDPDYVFGFLTCISSVPIENKIE